MLKKQFTNTSRLLLRLHSTNFKLISNLVSNFLYIENDMDQVDKVTHQVDSVSLMLLAVSNIFICLSSHDCTLIIDVAIYFILGSLPYLFHTNFLLLRVLLRVQKMKKIKFQGIDAHVVHAFRNPRCMVISVSVTYWKYCQQL